MSSKVIAPSSIIEAFETLLSSAATTIDEETGNPSYQPCADFYVYCILASLPWGGTELVEVMSKLCSFWGKKIRTASSPYNDKILMFIQERGSKFDM